MFNPDQRDEDRRPRSLLSIGQGAAKPASARTASPSLVSLAPTGPSAAERHRSARAKRETRSGTLLGSLSKDEPRTTEDAPPRQSTTPTAARSEEPAETQVPPRHHDERAPSGPAGTGGDEWRPLMDPWTIWNGIVRSRWIILAATVAGAALGVAVALSTPKKYESVAELLVDPRDLKISDRNVTEGGLPSDATLAIVENQVRVLTSGNVLSKVVDQLNLSADPEFNGQAEGFGLGSLVAGVRALFSSSAGGDGDVRRALAIRNLAESLDVERGGKTFVVSIGATTESPEKSALIANTLTTTFLQSYGEIQSDTAGRASDELTGRLAELQQSVEDAERKVETYKAERDLIDAQGRLITDDEIVKLNDQLSIARARTIELNARADSTRNLDPDAVIGGNLPEQISSPVMAELRTQYATARQEVDRASVRLGPRHPERLAAEAQLQSARNSLASELRRISSSIQIDLRRAVQLEQDLASRLAQLKARQGNVSEDLVTLRELEREAAAKRAVYESFLLRARETNEQRGINTANMSVISVAQPPLDPLGPSRAVTAIAGTMLGFFAGVGIGGLRGAVDSLRTGGGGSPTSPAPRRAPAPATTPRGRDDEIDRIMRSAANRWTPDTMSAAPPEPLPASSRDTGAAPLKKHPEEPVQNSSAEPDPATISPAAGTADPTSAPGKKDTAMHPQPIFAYPPEQAPAQPWPSQAWYEQQAAMAAHQQALHQAWVARQQQPVYAQPAYSPQAAPYWWQPQGYAAPAQMPYPAPAAMQSPPHWPGQPNFAGPPSWAPPVSQPYPPQAAPRAQPVQQSPLEEIRDSLREFREAVRDLAETRSRGRV